MSDLFDQVSEDQDPLTKIVGKIPGFGGYIEREARRAADKLLRESIADRYAEIWKKIGEVQKDLAGQSMLEHLDELENAAMKVQTFIDKIRTASYGNSGFFDAIKINEEELARLYEFDLALLDSSDEIQRALDNVVTSVGEKDSLPAAVSNLLSVSRDLVTAFEHRNDAITASESV